MQNQGFIIALEGLPYLFIGIFISLLLAYFHFTFLTVMVTILTIFVAFFFRNPHRVIPQQEGLILSPADGKICMIVDAHEGKFLKEKRKRISIFMSPFNCHINRSPVSATVVDTHYHPGKFHLASVDKASDLNEQHALLLEDAHKRRFVVVQIAGWLCRRIVNDVKSGQSLLRGQRFGLIQFGSRVDIYLPNHIALKVKLGDQVKGGETILGEFL